MEKVFRITTILSVLKWVLILLLSGMFLILLVQTYHIICRCTPLSICELITNWLFLKYLLIACFSILTLYIAGKQLQKHTDIACINALTELRKLLTSDRNRSVHFALSPEEEKVNILEVLKENEENGLTTQEENVLTTQKEIPIVDVYNYLGTIELGILMVRRGLIDMDTFYSKFGYRIENIFEENSNVHIKIREGINNSKAYYKNLLWGYNEIRKKFLK